MLEKSSGSSDLIISPSPQLGMFNFLESDSGPKDGWRKVQAADNEDSFTY